MWRHREDTTKPVLTGEKQIQSAHGRTEDFQLPETAVLLYMSGLDYIREQYKIELITKRFPRFLNACPVWRIQGEKDICLLDGGRGAPMAADTLEVLRALGVRNVVSAGLMGGFSRDIHVGDVIIPNRAYVEEGTSLHYYEFIEYSEPDTALFQQLTDYIPNHKIAPIVSMDAIYRQTFYKEALWRQKGCVGVDMETSALYSVGKYLELHVASVSMVSDRHPVSEADETWEWGMTKELRQKMLRQVIDVALSL